MHADSQTVKQQFKSNAFEKKDRFQNCNLVDNRTSYLHQRNLASLIQRATCPKQIPSQSPSEKVIQRVPLDQFIINMTCMGMLQVMASEIHQCSITWSRFYCGIKSHLKLQIS